MAEASISFPLNSFISGDTFFADFSVFSTSETAPIQRERSFPIDSISRPAANPRLIALNAVFAAVIATPIEAGSNITFLSEKPVYLSYKY